MGYRNRKRKRNVRLEIDEEEMSVECHFNRKFSYLSCNEEIDRDGEVNGISPKISNEIKEIKLYLNSAKNLLSSFDIVKWRNHTQFMHRGGDILRYIKKCIKPELSTKAWCKFYEILSHFSSELHFGDTFNSLHLCEAPGAFVTSLNHFLHINDYQGSWNWGASTLNPLYEGNDFGDMIDADNFIRETLDHWYFGSDDTGNIMALENIEHIQKVCKENFKEGVHMITCDGSIDCANEPEDQERNVFPLQYCEVVASLSILKEGGMMVLKMFTMFEAPAISLMYLMSSLFQNLYVFKPVTSKPGNSEVYIVAIQFRGISEILLQQLKDNIRTGRFKQDLEVFPLDTLPNFFLSEHVECCKMFATWQKETILENVQSFSDPEAYQNIKPVKKSFVQKFLSIYKIRKLRENLQVVPNQSTQQHVPEGQVKEAYIGRGHTGSLNERKKTLSLSVLERLASMERFDLESSESHLVFQHHKFPYLNGNWRIIYGKMFGHIGSSRFCNRSLLQTYNECLRSDLAVVANKNLKSLEEEFFINQVADLIKKNDVKVIYSSNDSVVHKLDSMRKLFDVEIINQSRPMPKHLRIESFIPVDGDDTSCIVLDQSCIVRFLDIALTVEKGCSLLFPIGALLSRISAQMFLILLSSFEQVSVFRYGQLPYMYIFANSCMGISKEIQSKLEEVCDSFEVADKNQGMLSFLPSNVSYDASAIDTLQEVNDNYLRMRINYFLTLL